MADYLDPQNREVKTTAEEMLKPTKPALREIQVVIDKLTDKIEVLNKEASVLSTAIGTAVKSTNGLGDKLDELSKVMKARLDAAAAVKGGNKTSKKAPITEDGLKKVLTEALKPSKELIEIHEKVISKHTIYVRDDRMFQATRVLINRVEALSAQMGGMIATRSTRKVTPVTASAKHDDIIAAAEASGRVEPTASAAAVRSAATPSGKQSAAEVDYNQFKFNATQSAKSLGQTKGEWFEILEALEKSELIKTRTGRLDKKHVKQLALMSINSQRYSESQRKLIAKELEMIRLKQEEGATQKEIDKSIEKLLKLLSSVNASVDLEKKLVSRLRDEWFGTLKTVDEYKQAMEDATVQLSKNIKGKIVAGLAAIPAALASVTGINKVFDGAITKRLEFLKTQQALDYAQGEITKKTISAQNAVLETGQDQLKVYKAIENARKKGFKDERSRNVIAKEGVKLGTMIGAEAEETSEFLAQWSQSMRMSVDHSRSFARELHSVGRITGIVGSDLINAAKSAESITKNLRNLGRLDVSSAGGVTKLIAEAKKHGVESEMADFAAKLSDPNALEADSQAFNLAMLAADRVGMDTMKIRSGGGLLASEDRKSLGQGIQQIVNDILNDPKHGILTSEQRARGINLSNFKDEANADEIAFRLAKILPKLTGYHANQLESLSQALIASSKTNADELAEIEKSLSSNNLTTQERTSLEAKRQTLKFNEFESHASGISDLVSKNGLSGISEYFKNKKNKDDLISDLKQAGITNADQLTDQELSHHTLRQIGVDTDKLNNNSASELREAIDAAIELQNKKETLDRAPDGSLLGLELEAHNLNATLSDKIATPLASIAEFLGNKGVLLIGALTAVSSGLGGLMGALLGKGIGGLLGGGGNLLMRAIGGGAGLIKSIGGSIIRTVGSGVMRIVGGTLLKGVVSTLGSAIALKGMAVAAAGALGYGAGWLIRQIPGVEPALEGMGSSVANWWDKDKIKLIESRNAEAHKEAKARESSTEYQEAKARREQTVGLYGELDKALQNGDSDLSRQIAKNILQNTNNQQDGGSTSEERRFALHKISGISGLDAESKSLSDQIRNKEKIDEIRDSLVHKYSGRGMSVINKTPEEMKAVEAHNKAVRAELEAETARLAAEQNLNMDGTYIKMPTTADSKLPANSEAAIEDKLRQERASGNKDSAGTAVAEGIGNVEENTKSTVEELRKLHVEMKQLIALFKNNVPTMAETVEGMAKNDATSKRKPKTSTNFHQWQIARYTSNPAKGVVDNLV